MTDKNILSIQKRDIGGKGAKQLRKQGVVPANIFGGGKESAGVCLEKKTLIKMLSGVGETPLFYLKTEKNTEIPVLIDELQLHPLSGEPSHISFKRVSLLEKISSEIPVELVGENTVSAAVVVLALNSIEVEALPADLPEKFEIDISTLTEVGQTLGFSDLSYDKNKISLLVDEEKLTEPIVLLQEVKEEVVVEEPKTDTEGAETTDGEEKSEDKPESSKEGDSQKAEKSGEEKKPARNASA